jgi:hypothetical protein
VTPIRRSDNLPEIATARRQVFEDRLARAEPVVTRAVQRGELPEGTDPAELLRTLAAPIYLRLLITADPVDDRTAAHAGAAPGRRGRAGQRGRMLMPSMRAPTSVRGRWVLPGANTT